MAAATVVLFHVGAYTQHSGDLASALPAVELLVQVIGAYGVPTFIVLSGFVLTLPVASAPDLRLKRGFWQYLRRRARRILPPYYVSLLLFLVMIALIPALHGDSGTAWDSKVPVTAGGVVSHLLVVHNWNTAWVNQINGPAWSVATEWQLYIFFPLVLLPLWRRFGPVVMLGVVSLMGIVVTLGFPPATAGGLWYVTLFALGSLAAYMVAREKHLVRPGLLAAAALVCSAAFLSLRPLLLGLLGGGFGIAAGYLIGIAMALLLIALARAGDGSPSQRVRGILESGPLVWLGSWSYSLYLIHSPVLALGNFLLLRWALPTGTHMLIQLLITAPIAAAAAFIFHVLVERRFLTSHQQKLVAGQAQPKQGRAAS